MLKLLLLALLVILPTACSLTNDDDRDNRDVPTAVPTNFVVPTQTTAPTPTPTTAPQATQAPQPTAVSNLPCQIPSGWVPYRVVAGDTLNAIARRSGTTADQLTRGNCLTNPNDIKVGSIIYVPQVVIVPTWTPVPSQCTLTPRLFVGGLGRVTPGDPNTLRSGPGTTGTSRIGEIPAGGVFSVLAGPQCAGGIYWWQVNYNGAIGWTGEGVPGTYWVEPYAPTTCSLAPLLTVGGQGRVLPGLANVVRSQPGRGSGSVVVGEIQPGTIFAVLAGPQCSDGINWWQINAGGLIGWTGEGQGSSYWVEPYTTTACLPAPRLMVGYSGVVLPGASNALRSQPGLSSSGSTVIGEIPGGRTFRVLAGPQCTDGYNWWRVNYGGFTGWTAEGQGNAYWTDRLKCSQSMYSRLDVNMIARVTPGSPNRLRLTPGTNGAVIGEIPGGATFTIVGGPQCGSEGWIWWQVDYNGTLGWTAEGDSGTVWLDPVS
jgi:LysM repeat protein